MLTCGRILLEFYSLKTFQCVLGDNYHFEEYKNKILSLGFLRNCLKFKYSLTKVKNGRKVGGKRTEKEN